MVKFFFSFLMFFGVVGLYAGKLKIGITSEATDFAEYEVECYRGWKYHVIKISSKEFSAFNLQRQGDRITHDGFRRYRFKGEANKSKSVYAKEISESEVEVRTLAVVWPHFQKFVCSKLKRCTERKPPSLGKRPGNITDTNEVKKKKQQFFGHIIDINGKYQIMDESMIENSLENIAEKQEERKNKTIYHQGRDTGKIVFKIENPTLPLSFLEPGSEGKTRSNIVTRDILGNKGDVVSISCAISSSEYKIYDMAYDNLSMDLVLLCLNQQKQKFEIILIDHDASDDDEKIVHKIALNNLNVNLDTYLISAYAQLYDILQCQ